MKVYAVLAALVLVVGLGAYLAYEGHLGSRLRADYDALRAKRTAAEQEADRVLGEVAAKDEAIIGMSQRIKDLSGQADAARARAGAAEAEAGAARDRAALMRAEISRLAALAASRARPEGRGGAIRALAELGYPSPAPALQGAAPEVQRP